MTRYAIDAAVALRLLADGITVSPEHQLVGPNLLRSQALAEIYRLVRGGELTDKQGLALLDGIATMRIRLLGDRVSRATAFRLARQHDWDDTADAEYLAVAQLQADAFVTLDEGLARRAEGIVPVASYDVLLER